MSPFTPFENDFQLRRVGSCAFSFSALDQSPFLEIGKFFAWFFMLQITFINSVRIELAVADRVGAFVGTPLNLVVLPESVVFIAGGASPCHVM